MAMELEQWLRENPRTLQGVSAHAAELQRLKALGYTQEQMRAWLATQGLQVSRQAISKFFLRERATSAPPEATPAPPQRAPTGEVLSCNPSKNPSGEPQHEPAAATLKGRAQRVGDRYLQRTLSPLAQQLLKPPSKA